MERAKQMNLSIQKDVPIHGLENTSVKESWFILSRPTIRSLIASGNHETYLCACALCIPWMDGCYTIDKFGYDTVRHNPTSLSGKYSAIDVIKFIFFHNKEDNPSKDDLKSLATFYNSLKHGGFLRPGQRVWQIQFYATNEPLVNKSSKSIYLQKWVADAINRIDQLLIDATFD